MNTVSPKFPPPVVQSRKVGSFMEGAVASRSVPPPTLVCTVATAPLHPNKHKARSTKGVHMFSVEKLGSWELEFYVTVFTQTLSSQIENILIPVLEMPVKGSYSSISRKVGSRV